MKIRLVCFLALLSFAQTDSAAVAPCADDPEFLKQLPEKISSEDSMYLCGKHLFDHMKYALARDAFKQYAQDFPNGSSRISALGYVAAAEGLLTPVDREVQNSCEYLPVSKEKVIPEAVHELMKKYCERGPFVTDAIDLNKDGSPEYQVCCTPFPHGSCVAAFFGKVGGKWQPILEGGMWRGYTDSACDNFVVLKQRHNGFNDFVSLDPTPNQWYFEHGKYHSMENEILRKGQ